MSTGTTSAGAQRTAISTAAVPFSTAELYRINVSEYERLVSLGAFDDSRLELIDGFLVRKLGKNPPHVRSVDATQIGLDSLLLEGWLIRRESPVRLPEFDEPEPDVAVVRGTRDDYRNRHPAPTDVGLLVEVALSSLERDRGEKLKVYARSGMSVYRIINLRDKIIEVYTNPEPSGYRNRADYTRGMEIPVILDGIERGRLRVDDLLP